MIRENISYAGYQCLVMSVMIFVVFMNVKIQKEIARKVFMLISTNSLGMYMLSYIGDRIVYERLLSSVMGSFGCKLLFFPVAVLMVLVISFGLSAVVTFVSKRLYFLCVLLCQRVCD